MHRPKTLLGLVSIALLAAVSLGRELAPASGVTADDMTAAAERFVAALSQKERAQAALSFDDSDRGNWHFVPTEMHARKGLPVQGMSQEVRLLAHGLLHSGLGKAGYLKATTIMSLESILHRLEPQGKLKRDPELYYFSVFGTPGPRGKWGWRVEGHHLSLNFTVEDNRIVSATPAFFGANPARVSDGSSREGLRTLPAEEDLARSLYTSLNDAHRRKAQMSSEAPKDIREPSLRPPTDEAVGLQADELSEPQRDTLTGLIREYATRMPAELAERWLDEIKQAGIGNIRFAWAGADQPGRPHYYRIEGPTFLIEYANVQNGSDGKPANHIHSLWRSRLNDFALGG